MGKTVLLDRMRDEAEAEGIHTLRIEAPEARSLPAILAPELRRALLRLSRNERATELARRALRGLAGFATALKIKYQDIEVLLIMSPSQALRITATSKSTCWLCSKPPAKQLKKPKLRSRFLLTNYSMWPQKNWRR